MLCVVAEAIGVFEVSSTGMLSLLAPGCIDVGLEILGVLGSE
jgi:hypothetical protein